MTGPSRGVYFGNRYLAVFTAAEAAVRSDFELGRIASARARSVGCKVVEGAEMSIGEHQLTLDDVVVVHVPAKLPRNLGNTPTIPWDALGGDK